ncbi:quaternary ammonium compound-resistance protein SugE [Panacagrimonas perspica]|uniref:Guanidinium exporter n=1 Tax=Panacagrimonas perspica TaxID=381431 RepID=A0A4S3JYT0_9GAMM|nr:multidrug efflux SMR transporter [Panacagrimonas perspica]TDU28162.1 quaternary ammonium compound-resistance protein SugE [Panacagrimonas perspica]THD00658.1 QacE family quaternary ammonium compound efflux SMR transporter [Panacagrimonas perspica]
MTSWIILGLAGLLEVVFAVALKQSRGLSHLPMAVLAGIAMLCSLTLLALAMRSIPVSAAYAIWTGIGAVGTVVAGILLFGEAASVLRVTSLSLILAGMVGLKLGADA